MLTIFLPGFSGQYNGPEMMEIVEYLKSKGHNVQDIHWPHWQDEKAEFLADTEVEKVWHVISGSADKDIVIVAKSIGTWVAARLMHLHPEFNPQKVILLGVPVSSLPEEDMRMYPEYFSRVSKNLHIIQNEHDPFGSSDQVRELFSSTPAQLVTKAENATHAYNYKEDVEKLINA